MRSITLLSTLMAAAVSGVKADGLSDFHQAGWPTMTLFAGISFIALSIFYGMQRGKQTARDGSHFSIVFKLLTAILAVIGIFLIFGPGEPGPKVNILGFQILVVSALGFYTFMTNLKSCAQALLVIVTVTILSLVGCFPWMNHNSAVFMVDQLSCIAYFGSTNINFNRCLDKGYLQLIRTFSLFALFALTVQMAQLFLLVTDDHATTNKSGGGSEGEQPSETANSSLLGSDASQSQGQVYSQQPQAQVYAQQPYAPPTAVVPPAAGGTGYQAL